MPETSKGRLPAILTDTTPRVVAAVLFCLATVLFFEKVPVLLRWPARILWGADAAWLGLVVVRKLLAVRFGAKGVAFSLALGGMVYAALLLICHVFVKLMSSRDERIATRALETLSDEHKEGIRAMLDGSSYETFDREIGWVPRPGFKGDGVTVSGQGVRSLHDYPVPPPDPERRVLCLGDSFTFGVGVDDKGTYPFQAEQLHPGTEWVNLGIAGGCLLQDLLHYRKNGKAFGGKHVVIGLMTDDAKRTVNCFRAFLTPFNPFTKPFAKYQNGTFSIEPNPFQDISDYRKLLENDRPEIARLLKMDYLSWSNQAAASNPVLRTALFVRETMHVDRNLNIFLGRTPSKPKRENLHAFDPYGRLTWDAGQHDYIRIDGAVDPYGQAIWHPESPGFTAVTMVVDALYEEIVADGRAPLIVVIPGPLDLENSRKHVPRVYRSLLEHFVQRHYHFFDFLESLVTRHKNNLAYSAIFNARHFLAPVNKELAEEVSLALGLH